MALTLTKQLTFDLSASVGARLSAFAQSRSEAQLNDETEFYKQVNEKGMSFDEQLSFRQGQLEKENNRAVPDQTYIRSLKKDISDLKKQVASQRFQDAYMQSYTDLKTGHESWNDHIEFLQNQLSSTSDPELKTTINQYLSQAKQDQYQTEQQIADNFYQFAVNDKTTSVLNDAIARAKKEKATALGGGDTLRASALDMKLQSLNKTLQETQVSNAIHQFDMGKLNTYDPASFLDSVQQQITNADGTTPVTINGETYNSAKEYWQSYQANYFNSGEFDKALTSYYNDVYQIALNKSVEAFPAAVATSKTQLDALLARPDLAQYKTLISGSVANVLSNGSSAAADSIIDKATTNYDFQSAANKLAQLQHDTGVDQTPAYNKLITQISQVKSDEVTKLLAVVQNNVANGQNPQTALNNALSLYNQGKLGTNPSPEELANKNVGDIAKDATLGTGKPDTRSTVETPAALQTYTEGELLKDPTSPLVYKYEGGQIRPIYLAPGATEAQLKATTGKGFADVKVVPNIAGSGLKVGQNLDIAAPPKLIKVKNGQKYGTFAPQTVFVEEGNELRPVSSQEKLNEIAPGIAPSEVDAGYFNGKKIGANY